MKTIMALATVLMMGSAYAQSDFDSSSPSDYESSDSYWGSDRGTGQGAGGATDQHMIESNVDSLVRGAYSFDKTKTRGSSADNDSQLDLSLNYAVKFKENWQGGVRLNYLKDTASVGDQEDYGFQVGAFYNVSENLMESIYVSLFTGLEWRHVYGALGNPSDEVWKTTFALGKRFGLARWNIAHLVYSPEIAMVTANSTTGSIVEYQQNVELRFLQFSLFF